MLTAKRVSTDRAFRDATPGEVAWVPSRLSLIICAHLRWPAWSSSPRNASEPVKKSGRPLADARGSAGCPLRCVFHPPLP